MSAGHVNFYISYRTERFHKTMQQKPMKAQKVTQYFCVKEVPNPAASPSPLLFYSVFFSAHFMPGHHVILMKGPVRLSWLHFQPTEMPVVKAKKKQTNKKPTIYSPFANTVTIYSMKVMFLHIYCI